MGGGQVTKEQATSREPEVGETKHLTPALSPRRGRKGCRVRANWQRWIQADSGVQCAKSFGERSPRLAPLMVRRGSPHAPQNAEREERLPRLSQSASSDLGRSKGSARNAENIVELPSCGLLRCCQVF
jgi:hypothetical protein